MVRGHWSSIIVGLALITLALVLAGCSGAPFPGTDPDDGPPPPPEGTAEIDGVVVDSENPNTLIAGATVTPVADGVSDAPAATTNSAGQVSLDRLPAGGVTLQVRFPLTGTYQAMDIRVDTQSNTTTQTTIAALRAAATPPTSVTLNPSSATVDIGGQVLFTADVRVSGVPVDITPSFSLIGEVGTLSAAGMFRGTRVGTGDVKAFFPAASATADVEVVGPQPPRLGTLSVSPTDLPAGGGNVRIAISATDGDGVVSVRAEIVTLNHATISWDLVLDPAGNERDGSWISIFPAPPNDNPISPDGVQLDQRYNVRVRATDRSGASTTSPFAEFVVVGLESPPPPP